MHNFIQQNQRSDLKIITLIFTLLTVLSNVSAQEPTTPSDLGQVLIVLGTVQDAGSPHIGCRKSCCRVLFQKADPTRKVVSLGIIDHETNTKILIDATPDIVTQIRDLHNITGNIGNEVPNAIFLTHAHIGHYTGLMHLGREAFNTKDVPVYAMQKMSGFLETNGPWDLLIKLNNIKIQPLHDEKPVHITPNITITPYAVPHRGEYSETVGFLIEGKHKKALFIPDIDKWHLWTKNIKEEIAKVDYAFLDATFFDNHEVNNRNMAEIPHPFVKESMDLFEDLPVEEKAKIHFIHFNHTNPALVKDSPQTKMIHEKGYNIASYLQTIKL